MASRDTQAALVGQREHSRLSSSLTEGMDELKDCQLSVWGDSIGIDLDGLVELGAEVAQELFLLWHVVHHDRQLQQPRSPCCACIKAPSPHCVSGPAAAAAATHAHARARTAIRAQASSHVTVLEFQSAARTRTCSRPGDRRGDPQARTCERLVIACAPGHFVGAHLVLRVDHGHKFLLPDSRYLRVGHP